LSPRSAHSHGGRGFGGSEGRDMTATALITTAVAVGLAIFVIALWFRRRR
jgi:hypothetical protein